MVIPPAPLTLIELRITNDGVGHAAHGGRSLAPPNHRLSRWFQTLKQPKSNLADGYIVFIIPLVSIRKNVFLQDENIIFFYLYFFFYILLFLLIIILFIVSIL